MGQAHRISYWRSNAWVSQLVLSASLLSATAAGVGEESAHAGATVVSYKVSPKDVIVHGWLMWTAMGVCLPVGIIVVRMVKGAIRTGGSSKRIQALVYTHMAAQGLGVLFSVAGAAVGFRKFDNKFRYTHERLGLSLLLLTWLMPFTGLLRPQRGLPTRPIWYGLHWLMGTATTVLGLINIYIGMRIYEQLFTESLRTLNILYSIQLSMVGAAYLAQDRWRYLREQGDLSAKNAVPPLVHSQISSRSNGRQG